MNLDGHVLEVAQGPQGHQVGPVLLGDHLLQQVQFLQDLAKLVTWEKFKLHKLPKIA